jgi:cytoskeletal protein CcmA (bactofilin family)
MTNIRDDNLVDDDYDTILSADIDFKGTLKFEKSFLVRGRIEGKIDATGTLLVDVGAVVLADIRAAKVIVRGTVTGNITAMHKIEVSSSGKVAGDVHSPEIQMETGCVFNGLCKMEKVVDREQDHED